MSIRILILLGILAAVAATGWFFATQLPEDHDPAIQAEIEQLVQAYDNALYLAGDYEAAQTAANKIVEIAESSEDPAGTEVRGLARLAYMEIEFGKWGNRWRKKIKRCEELITDEPTVARAEFLLYSGIIKGKYNKKFDEGIKLVEESNLISSDLQDDRTLALSFLSLSELNSFCGRRGYVAKNSYHAVTIAKHHGQQSVYVCTLRHLIRKLIYLGKFAEASESGKKLLAIEPNSHDALFTTFLSGESDKFLHTVEKFQAEVKKRQKNSTATNRNFGDLGRSLRKLAVAYAVRQDLPACRKYANLAIPYLKIVGDDTSLKGCHDLLHLSKLDQAESTVEINKIASTSKAQPDEIFMTALANAYARVGDLEASKKCRKRVDTIEKDHVLTEIGILKASSELYWKSEVSSRERAAVANQQEAESQRRVWLLSTGLIMGLTVSVLLGGFYLLLRRERNLLEETVEKRTRSLSEAVQAASAADQAKSDFLAQINHEIRNPLTAILGYCDLLSLSRDRTVEFISGIESSSLHLRELVDKILEVSKIESNDLEIKLNDFLPAQTTNDINGIMLEQATKKGLQFSCSFRGDPTCSISSDETKIRQIALNLIGNAIKFTESGSVAVSFALNKDDATLSIIVKDTGIGIAEEETQAVFDRFAKASNGVVCDGSGLGLFITKQLVKCLDGEIALDSELGVGTQVTVKLPVTFTCDLSTNSESTDGRDVFEPADSIGKEGIKVILVDDQEIIRTSMKLLLDANGIECKTAQNLEQTMELLENWQPDLILLDLRMPKQSGYEVFQSIRQSVNSGVPVYAMTGDATAQVREKCLEAGFDGFIIKPFKIKTIQNILEAKAEAV